MILAIDTSQMTYSLALSNGWFQSWDDINQSIYHMIDDHHIPNLEAVIINLGPGRFSGIRSGIAFAKGLALAKDIPVYGVSHFEVITQKVDLTEATIALDARKSQAYTQTVHQGRLIDEIKLLDIESLNDKNLVGNFLGDIITTDARDLLPMVQHKSPTDLSKLNAIYLRNPTD